MYRCLYKCGQEANQSIKKETECPTRAKSIGCRITETRAKIVANRLVDEDKSMDKKYKEGEKENTVPTKENRALKRKVCNQDKSPARKTNLEPDNGPKNKDLGEKVDGEVTGATAAAEPDTILSHKDAECKDDDTDITLCTNQGFREEFFYI